MCFRWLPQLRIVPGSHARHRRHADALRSVVQPTDGPDKQATAELPEGVSCPSHKVQTLCLLAQSVRLGLLLLFELMPELAYTNGPGSRRRFPTLIPLPRTQVPVRSLETTPGTVIVFTEEVWHSSFGSDVGRLQITSQVRARNRHGRPD